MHKNSSASDATAPKQRPVEGPPSPDMMDEAASVQGFNGLQRPNAETPTTKIVHGQGRPDFNKETTTKAAVEQWEKLQDLGLDSFSELPFSFCWARKEGEDDQVFKSRRVSEGIKLSRLHNGVMLEKRQKKQKRLLKENKRGFTSTSSAASKTAPSAHKDPDYEELRRRLAQKDELCEDLQKRILVLETALRRAGIHLSDNVETAAIAEKDHAGRKRLCKDLISKPAPHSVKMARMAKITTSPADVNASSTDEAKGTATAMEDCAMEVASAPESSHTSCETAMADAPPPVVPALGKKPKPAKTTAAAKRKQKQKRKRKKAAKNTPSASISADEAMVTEQAPSSSPVVPPPTGPSPSAGNSSQAAGNGGPRRRRRSRKSGKAKAVEEKVPEGGEKAASSAMTAPSAQQKSIEAALQVAKKTVLDLQKLLSGNTQEKPTYAAVTAKKGRAPSSKNGGTEDPPATTSSPAGPSAKQGKGKANAKVKTQALKAAPKPRKAPRTTTAATQKETILILPPQEGTVIEKLTAANISPRLLGVQRFATFPSGAVLITLADKEKAAGARELLTKVGLQEKKAAAPRSHEFRIHGIPEEYNADELQLDLQAATGHSADKILFVPYSASNEKRKGCKLAVCQCSAQMFRAAQKKRGVRVGWSWCPIDARLRLPRCAICSLLGHTAKHCTGSKPAQLAAGSAPVCADCTSYNQRISSSHLPHTRRRRADHPTGVKSCPTKICLLRKVAKRVAKASTDAEASPPTPPPTSEGDGGASN